MKRTGVWRGGTYLNSPLCCLEKQAVSCLSVARLLLAPGSGKILLKHQGGNRHKCINPLKSMGFRSINPFADVGTFKNFMHWGFKLLNHFWRCYSRSTADTMHLLSNTQCRPQIIYDLRAEIKGIRSRSHWRGPVRCRAHPAHTKITGHCRCSAHLTTGP